LILIYIFIFILGLLVGSFLNVLIDRIPREEKVIGGRSYCENCDTPLPWYDLIPVVSFVTLKGKCRKCKIKLSWYYPIVELVTGLSFVAIWYWSTSPYWIFIVSSLIVIFFIDLKYGIIPDKIIYPTILISLLYQFIFRAVLVVSLFSDLKSDVGGLGPYLLKTSYFSEHSFLIMKPLVFTILGSVGIFLFFYFLFYLTKGKGMGGGDVKYSFLMGLVSGWPNMIISLFLSFLTGSLVSLILILVGKKKMKQTIPFGPFLVTGTFLGIVFGERIFSWYLGLL